jgi:prepilin-type N-terminal cleavage/methylation domain-containing protein
MKIKPSGRAGFTLTEIMIVVGIIGLLAEIAIPNYIEARINGRTSVCLSNLRQIDNAKLQWAFEELRSPTTAPAFVELAPYLNRGSDALDSLYCPQDDTKNFDNSYNPGDSITPPECLKSPESHILHE